MYCTKCGTKVMDDSRFCHTCGAEVQSNPQVSSPMNQEIPSQNQTHVNEFSNTMENDDVHFANFVGNNYQFYKNKWDRMNNPASSPSWNWASFFLGPFWLGYRKMYVPIFILLGIYVFLDTIDTFNGYNYDSSPFTYLITFVLYILLGIYGNALYYRHANKKIQMRKHTFADGSELKYIGGTSAKGVFVSIGLMFVYFLYLVFILPLFGTYDIIFGTNEGSYGITGVKDSFQQHEEIYYEVDFGKVISRSTVEIHVVKTTDNYEQMYWQFEEAIDPTWTGFYNIFYDPLYDEPLEPGKYKVRAFNDGELISEGQFTIRN